jgi:hypothetical protein
MALSTVSNSFVGTFGRESPIKKLPSARERVFSTTNPPPKQAVSIFDKPDAFGILREHISHDYYTAAWFFQGPGIIYDKTLRFKRIFALSIAFPGNNNQDIGRIRNVNNRVCCLANFRL